MGGPQILGDKPVADCSSLVRLGNKREVCSCEGDPAPILAPDRLPRPAAEDLLPENGDLEEGIDEGSGIGAIEDKFRWSWPSGRGEGPMAEVGARPVDLEGL